MFIFMSFKIAKEEGGCLGMVISMAKYRKMMQVKLPLPQLIRLHIENQGITIEQLAFMCHVHPSTMSRWLSGKRAITPDAIVSIASALNRPDLVDEYCHSCACRCRMAGRPKPAA